MMKYFRPLYAFLLGLMVILNSSTFANLALINSLGQLLLFILVVCIPIWRTGRMSYVDIGWPWGLVCIGLLVLFLGEGYWLRTWLVGGMYLFSGLRMGVGALVLWKKGHLDTELSRYQFQRKRWEKQGYTNDDLSLQYEIMIQCFANITFLALPAMLQAFNPNEFISPLEIIGYFLWFLFLILEHIADLQKQKLGSYEIACFEIGLITKDQLSLISQKYNKSDYGQSILQYLKTV